MFLIGVEIALLLPTALIDECFHKRPVDGLDAGPVFDQKLHRFKPGVLGREEERRFLLFREFVRVASEVKKEFHEVRVSAHGGVMKRSAAIVVREVDLRSALDKELCEILMSVAADGVKKRHALMFAFDAVVGIVIEEPDGFLEEILFGEIPGECVGAERAVDFFAGFLFSGHDGAEFENLSLAEGFAFGEFIEACLQRGCADRNHEKDGQCGNGAKCQELFGHGRHSKVVEKKHYNILYNKKNKNQAGKGNLVHIRKKNAAVRPVSRTGRPADVIALSRIVSIPARRNTASNHPKAGSASSCFGVAVLRNISSTFAGGGLDIS